jgi:hypothetical protein
VNGKLKALVLVVAAGGAGVVVRAMKQARSPATAPEQAGRAGVGEVGIPEPSQSDVETSDVTYREPSQFQGSTRDELYREAKRRGIFGRSRMTKAELQAALEKETGPSARTEATEPE